MVKAVVITGCGINCDREMATACRAAGAEVELVHAQKLFSETPLWEEAQLLLFPGGFSFGDELGAAKVFANRLQHLSQKLQQFIDRGNCILGVCNGFQLLVKLGLLPGKDKQSASLACNDTGRFECRWVHHKVLPSHCIFTQGPEKLYLPIRHGEGKFVSEETEALWKNQQIVMQYEQNPNGSIDSIAAICDQTGRMMGMMAHPEAALYFTHDPRWSRIKQQNSDIPKFGPGFSIFKNAVTYLKEQECTSLSKQH